MVAVTLEWEEQFGNAPAITSVISEFDAAHLVGMTTQQYSAAMHRSTAVKRGHDFIHEGVRYQVKANRPSGKPGSFVTLVGKARNYDWDRLIWILYDREYVMQEAWLWDVAAYKAAFHTVKRLA